MCTCACTQEKEITEINEKCKDIFPAEDGPFIRALDETLGTMNVHREAYYGGTFTGNHAHKCLTVCGLLYMYTYYLHVQTQPFSNSFKPTNVDAICATLPRVATERCPDMDDMAQAVANKYGRALMLYSKCHGQFNSSNTFSDEALTSLRKYMYMYTQK